MGKEDKTEGAQSRAPRIAQPHRAHQAIFKPNSALYLYFNAILSFGIILFTLTLFSYILLVLSLSFGFRLSKSCFR